FYIVLHLLCGFLSVGIWMADVQERYPKIKDEYRFDLGISTLYGVLFGPITLVVFYALSGFAEHGCSLRRI
ncbi:MAG: hypothetical protein MIO92_04075, partial [Methanosarcinaceae archaeon]|nr:hypothetical protein [Methanosarcinaceae archaeon]